MIDKNLFKNNLELIQTNLKKRNAKINLKKIQQAINNQNQLITKIETFNATKNKVSKEIAALVKENKTKEINKLKKTLEKNKTEIEAAEIELKKLEDNIAKQLLSIPNLLHESVPIGKDENDNVVVRIWNKPTEFAFKPKPHWDLINDLKLGDFAKAVKISGSRFFIYQNLGSKLIRALTSFTLDLHANAGYSEYSLPVIVNDKALIGTGQLPKFKDDLFALTTTPFYLSPTLEVQLTNLYSNQILNESELPIKITASSLNFRSEAGSAGKDTRGIIRQHQFFKTEMVNIVKPENSFAALEQMTNQAELILKILRLPYRVIALCSGDIGFASSKTYDIEVWLPSYNNYKEISSCSNCIDFQARRAQIRYKNSKTKKNELVHTLNGSGLALDRLFAAVIENYQNKDGSITIPTALIPYMHCGIIK